MIAVRQHVAAWRWVTLTLAGLVAACAAADAANDPFLNAVRVAQASGVDRPTTAFDDGSGPSNVVLTSGAVPLAPYGAAAGLPLGETAGVQSVGYAEYGYQSPVSYAGWHLLPEGLIYRSYLAGPRESRFALHTFHNSSSVEGSEWLWDATLGGRRPILRYGNNDASNPVGWQLDIEGAAVVRLNLDEARDVDASDFRFGVPISYTAGDGVQYKLGYYHVSSHLGDELITRTGVNNRINYVRDALIAGVSVNPTPCWRLYAETAFAFFTAGGAEPWEFQFGAEYSRPGPTGFAGTPFFATNAHLREELDFGGDWTLQTGWLWRGHTGSVFRLGLHYMNGKSTQYQFFDRNEEQVGFGVWYDY